MYIVRNKATKDVLHKNRAPLRQNLQPAEVYHAFDADTMEIGKVDGILPEYWDIGPSGMVYELPLAERVARGFVPIPEGQKLEGDSFVPLSNRELIEAGSLPPERVRQILEEQIGNEYKGRIASVTVSIEDRGEWSVSKLGQIAGLIMAIDAQEIQDGEARLSVTDRRSRPGLTRAELKSISMSMHQQIDQLATKRSEKLRELDDLPDAALAGFDPTAGWDAA